VLSIQSHVVYGYAGNTAAVFPMQRLGREVWAVNTVEFSNHTGYGAWKGKVLGAQLVLDLVKGLEDRGVLSKCDAVLSGYLGDGEIGKAVVDAVKKVRACSPGALYACDPVMGDSGRGIYVKDDIPDIFKRELVPLADIITPNLFELETLTGINNINNIDAAKSAINALHEMGPSIVLLTSFKEKEGQIGMIVSDKKNIYIVNTPELPLECNVAGTGDMTTAVFLSRYLETKNIKKSLELCISSVYGILKAGYGISKMELNLTEAQKEFDFPSNLFEARELL